MSAYLYRKFISPGNKWFYAACDAWGYLELFPPILSAISVHTGPAVVRYLGIHTQKTDPFHPYPRLRYQLYGEFQNLEPKHSTRVIGGQFYFLWSRSIYQESDFTGVSPFNRTFLGFLEVTCGLLTGIVCWGGVCVCQFWFAFVSFVDIFVPTLLSANRFYILWL